MTKLEYVQQRIEQLRSFLLSSLPVTSINVSGESVQFDRAGALAELKDLEQQERDLLHPGNRRKTVDLSHAFG